MSEDDKTAGKGQQLYYAGIAAVVIIILVAVWLLFKSEDPVTPVTTVPEPVTVPVETLPEPLPEPELPPQEPEPEPEPEVIEQPEPEPVKPLPGLDQSDTDVREHLLALNWRAGLASLFVTEDILRNVVVQVDNIAEGQLISGHNVLTPLEQEFQVTEQQQVYVADEQNFRRYTPYIQLLESVPAARVLALYQRYEPLLQQAYEELGYPDSSFKSRLLQAIETLLDTPDISYPVLLERPSVMYTYADPELEALPAAQKQMLRLGAENQKRLKVLLRNYQQQLETL
ncbi:DUF3014 domain-containing protein [Chromatiaceae bacterium AAb-1]|nr:DUF3014 domain-containing protein [Chromatiaceae bacterium AAb-1]